MSANVRQCLVNMCYYDSVVFWLKDSTSKDSLVIFHFLFLSLIINNKKALPLPRLFCF